MECKVQRRHPALNRHRSWSILDNSVSGYFEYCKLFNNNWLELMMSDLKDMHQLNTSTISHENTFVWLWFGSDFDLLCRFDDDIINFVTLFSMFSNWQIGLVPTKYPVSVAMFDSWLTTDFHIAHWLEHILCKNIPSSGSHIFFIKCAILREHP